MNKINPQSRELMFYVIYEFHLELSNVNQFKKVWHQLTLDIREGSSGLGSRLHKVLNKPNCWLAYAKWQTKEDWINYAPLNIPEQAELTR